MARQGPVIVRGAPLDPALGLPIAAVREKRWNTRLEMAAAVLLIGVAVWAAVGWVTGHPVETQYGPAPRGCLCDPHATVGRRTGRWSRGDPFRRSARNGGKYAG